jgi:HEAT repeat protein
MRRWSGVGAELARIRSLENDGNVVGLIHELDSDVRGLTQYSIIRGHAANALGRLGDPRAVPYLVDLADDPEAIVRSDVFQALGRLHAHDAQSLLLDGLADPAPVVRMAAVEALGRLGDPTVLPRLWEVLDQDPDAEARMYAAESLALLGDENVASRIPQVLRDVGWRVRGHPRWKRLGEFAATGAPLETTGTP